MNAIRHILVGSVLLVSGVLTASCGRGNAPESTEHTEHGEHEGEPRGPRGGRLFLADGLQLELVLSGEEDPPAFKAYLYDGHRHPTRPKAEQLSATLERLGGRRDTVLFRIDGDHFHSTRGVEEPHSFTGHVILERNGKRRTWEFEQREGRIELAAEAISSAGIESGVAGPAPIEVRVETPGEIRLNAERVVQVRPRYPGVVREMRKRLGNPVRNGEALALVHSNESLSNYPIAAPMSGTIVSQDATVGQAVDHESVLYTLADLSSVWVDFPIYPQNVGQIRTGLRVEVRSGSGPPHSGQGIVSYVGPLLEQDTRVSYGRVVLDNHDGRWQPGLYVTVAITVERVDVRLAVPEEAIVRMSGGPAVFRAQGNRFEPQPVVVGRSDGAMTEIVEGLEPGATIVVKKAFLLKAELGKSEAGHEH